ncbi:MAG: tetratricopeptide repeat protein [Planctomycetes bacterium]|jgi:Fe-S cluster biosynthesis and repair protein YggX|nr:tetratricopeptide repeat protein [Planctomycetota bacterium]
MSTPERIAQFEKMASADPTNEMAHFSLGNALLQAGRHAEAARSLQRVIELSPGMSKAYQLCGQAQIGAGWADQAVVTLERGFRLASERGDRMVEQAIAKALESIGREPPMIERAAQSAAVAVDGGFICRRSGQAGTRLPGPPFRGPVGAWIGENISAETWRNWIGQGTKVINEMRLDFSRDKDQDIYDQHMREYLGIDDEVLAAIGAVKPVA